MFMKKISYSRNNSNTELNSKKDVEIIIKDDK